MHRLRLDSYMRFLPAIALLSLTLCRGAEVAQQPTVQVTPEKAAQRQTDDQDPDPRDNRKKVLTPEEEMQEQIRMFDPLAGNPRNIGPQGNQSPPGRNTQDNRTEGVQPRYAAPASGASDSPRDADYPGPTVQSDQPLPGSLAATRQEEATSGAGPRVSEDAAGAATGEYTGPAVLSRSYTIGSLSGPRDTKWKETLGFSSIYDTGTSAPVADATGAVHSTASVGTMFNWAISGQRMMRSDLITFGYSGNFSRYAQNGAANGSNSTATLTWTHLISRHLTLSMVNNGSLFSSNYSLQNPTLSAGAAIANLDVGSNATVDPNASSTKQINSMATLTWQQSARVSFTFGTSYFGIARSGLGMVGAAGEQAQGGVNYRYSRQTTVGLYYSYGHTQYAHGVGTSDTNSVGVNYSRAIGRSMQIRLRAGLAQTQTIAQSEVLVSPIVLALLGTPVGIVDAYVKRSTEDISGQILKDFGRRQTAFVAYTRGIAPGNGLLLTSIQTTMAVGLTSKMFRHYTMQVSGSSESLSAVAQTITRSYSDKGAQISVSRPYKGGFSMNFIASYRYYGASVPGLNPNQFRFTSGVAWSPVGTKLLPF
jgi:hypothetical protein